MINRHEFLIIVFVLATVLTIYFAWPFLNPPRTWKEVLGKPEFSKVDLDKPLRDQTRIAELAGRTFKIPLMFIDGQLSKGQLQQGINLKYVLPDFQSKWELKTREKYEEARRNQQFAHMLLEDASTRQALSGVLKNRRRLLGKEVYSGVYNGLDYYKWYQIQQGKSVHVRDVFVEKDKTGGVRSFIECAPERSVPYPSCEHKFINKGLLYYIYYNKAQYFPTWRKQRDKAVNFIDSFEQ